MAFEQFPYTNYHDLNLDWIITKVTEWSKQWEEVKKAYEDFAYNMTEVWQNIEALQAADMRMNNDIINLRGQFVALDNTVTAFTNYFDAVLLTIGNSLDDLNARVSDIETDATFYMFSPFTGLYEPLQDVIMELAQFHLADALTAAEYDALDLTAGYYDGKQLTAIQYDTSGKLLLP